MQAKIWDVLTQMPADQDFQAYHTVDEVWNNFIMHSHPYIEVYFFISGSIEIMVEDHLYQIQPWDMLIFPAGVMHKNMPVGNNLNYERAFIYATDNLLCSASRPECNLYEIFHTAAKNGQHHFRAGEEAVRNIVEKIDGVIALADDPSPSAQLINYCQMVIVLTLVSDIIRVPASNGFAAPDFKVSQILNYLNGHFTEEISLNDLANRFYTSKFHLLREFKEYTGTTIHQYLMEKRLVYAQLLLQSGTAPMEAAAACGFTDYAGFYRAFKRSTLVSPQEYQKNQKR